MKKQTGKNFATNARIKTNLTSFDWLEAKSRKYAVANNQLHKTFKHFTLNI